MSILMQNSCSPATRI